ncbi:MAG: zinc-ribbon domain-containing protein [Acidimicrobiales bacterium]
MFCTTCGNTIQEDAAYCVACGTSVSTGGQVNQAFPQSSVAPFRTDSDNKKRNVAFGVGAIGVVVVVIVLVLVLGGGNSPSATVRGFVAAMNAHDQAKMCSYISPGSQSACNSIAGLSLAFPSTTINSTSSIVQGNQAIVFVTGRVCVGGGCQSLSGTPEQTRAMGGGFNAAFSNALSSFISSNGNSNNVVPCTNVNGRWYIDMPASSFG